MTKKKRKKTFYANRLKKFITRDNEPNQQRMISGCFAVEEHDADKEIFELNEIVLKEGFESINLGPNLTEEYQEKLGRLVNEFNDLLHQILELPDTTPDQADTGSTCDQQTTPTAIYYGT